MRARVGAAAAAVWLAAGFLAGAEETAGFAIREVAVRGDAGAASDEGLLEAWKAELVGRTLTPAQVQEKAVELRDRLRERGYPLAAVRTPPADYATGVVPVEIDAGRFGRLSLTGPDGQPFEGRWFSADQLRYRLSGMAEGDYFRESVFYAHILGVNAHPDLVLDPELTVRKETEDGLARRYADIQCEVAESRPLHARVTVDNAGVDATGEWRAYGLVQYLNLTRRDDILSLFLGPVSDDSGSSRSAAASYLRPRLSGRGGSTLLYGGYSDVEAQEVAGLFTLQGEGWFVGVREDWRLAASPERETVLSAGVAWRSQEETFSVDETGVEEETRDVAVLPLSLGLQVTPLRLDRLGGRTFFEIEAVCGPGGIAGSEDDMEDFRPGAESTYLVGRLKLARLQPLGVAPRERAGETWLLFGSTELQAANGALLGAEQVALGGMESIRGFPERVMMGDQGGEATVELRSPLARLGASSHLQGVLFADGGHAIPEGDDDRDAVSMAGAGGGLRLAAGPHSLFKADLGVPVAGKDDVEEETGAEVDSVRVHVAATLQF